MTRITSGKVVLHQEIIDLREIATSFVLAHEDAFEGSRHIVRLDVAAVPVLVLGDKVRLEQVVSNLVTNALKYSPAGSHIDVCVASDAGKARLEVSDDGVGMDETLRDHVFDVFVQGGHGWSPRTIEADTGRHGPRVVGSTLVADRKAPHCRLGDRSSPFLDEVPALGDDERRRTSLDVCPQRFHDLGPEDRILRAVGHEALAAPLVTPVLARSA